MVMLASLLQSTGWLTAHVICTWSQSCFLLCTVPYSQNNENEVTLANCLFNSLALLANP